MASPGFEPLRVARRSQRSCSWNALGLIKFASRQVATKSRSSSREITPSAFSSTRKKTSRACECTSPCDDDASSVHSVANVRKESPPWASAAVGFPPVAVPVAVPVAAPVARRMPRLPFEKTAPHTARVALVEEEAREASRSSSSHRSRVTYSLPFESL